MKVYADFCNHRKDMSIHDILNTYWGYNAFRPLQEDIINSVLSGKDTLALLPTGGGKSICFQVPALAREGLCLVVSPLIALMKDQVENLKKRQIQAVALHSGMSRREIDITLDNCIYGDTKFLYLSPERLQTDLFLARVKKMKVNLLAIDEAHCISQWGYDFRPPYLQIAALREHLPGIPALALTASATPDVQEDIQEKLQFRQENIFRKSFARANLSYSVLPEEDKERKLLQILQNIPGTAVVYVRSRRKTQEIAAFLQRNSISATFYHAGLNHTERATRQQNWIDSGVRVMVATNAFGMGIDKPDVRVVVHLDLPENLESYYQEAGRAGRDEQKAYAVVLYNQADIDDLSQRVEMQFPEPGMLRNVYQALANYYQLATGSGEMASYDFDGEDFQKLYNLPVMSLHYSLKRLEDNGLLQLNEAFFQPSRLFLPVNNTELYKFQVSNPRFDLLLKVILRMYGGELFANYQKISETQIAAKIQKTLPETVKMLEYLHQNGMVLYEPQKDKPQLTFLTPRHDIAKLPLNIQQMEARKKVQQLRVDAMLAYAANTQRCRTLMLLDYFGETSDVACGVCDVCVKKKRQKMANDPTPYYRQWILQLLNGEPADLQQIFLSIPRAKEPDFLAAVREMVGNGELFYEPGGKVRKS
jgi:ATP-dependent DNA helicase RecQ